MKRSKKGNAFYSQIGVTRESDGSIHFTIKGVKSGHGAERRSGKTERPSYPFR